jgi:hypothetical protein
MAFCGGTVASSRTDNVRPGGVLQIRLSAVQCRRSYKLIGEIRVKPNDSEGEVYSKNIGEIREGNRVSEKL